METLNSTPTSSFKLALQLGSISGALDILYELIMYFTKKLEQGGSLWVVAVFIIIGVISGRTIKKYRNTRLGGYITFGKAFGICLQTYIYAGIISGVFLFILVKYISPGIPEHMLHSQSDALKVNFGSGSDQATTLQLQHMIVSPWFMTLMHFLSFTFTGLIASFIVAPICKKEQDIFAA